MKKYDLQTPEGTRDLLFDESAARRIIEERVSSILLSYGYSEVITPGLEFFDVFSSKSRYFAQESMYKLTDGRGRIMVLRPDCTLPIARVVATRFKSEPLPLKLFYNQNIYRVHPKNSGRDDEISQSGIEIIGGDEKRADFEALSTAVEIMKVCEAGDYRFEIGDIAFFKLLTAQLDLNEEEADAVRTYVDSKNYPELNKVLARFGDDKNALALAQLPHLFGGEEIFAEAERVLSGTAADSALGELKQIFDVICSLKIADKLTVDLGLINKQDYYTGVLFRGYASGYGMPILSGGRYDTLIGDFGETLPATGFGVNINAAANALMKRSGKNVMKAVDVVVFAENDSFAQGKEHCSRLVAENLVVDNSVCPDKNAAIEYARKRGIKRVDIVSGDKIEQIKL